jgi:hypothetical protein
MELHDLTIDFNVFWSAPKKPEEFEFPKCQIIVRFIKDGKESIMATETSCHEKYENLMTNVIEIALHPHMREFANRKIFDQHYQITHRNDEYQKALEEWHKHNRENKIIQIDGHGKRKKRRK